MIRALRPIYRLLERQTNWWSDRLSNDWYDLRTRTGLLNGLFSIVVNVVQFTLILLLVVILDLTGTGPTRPTTASLLVFPVAFLYGVAMFLTYQYVDRINTAMRTFPSNFKTGIPLQVLTYGSYALLLWYHAGLGVLAAVTYITGKLAILFVLFPSAELRRATS